jgi:hypothetical protein
VIFSSNIIKTPFSRDGELKKRKKEKKEEEKEKL